MRGLRAAGPDLVLGTQATIQLHMWAGLRGPSPLVWVAVLMQRQGAVPARHHKEVPILRGSGPGAGQRGWLN